MKRQWRGVALAIAAGLMLASLPLLGACTKEVVKEVPVEKVVEKEVIKEVPVERVVEKEVIKEVPVEKVVEVEVKWPAIMSLGSGQQGSPTYVAAAGLGDMIKKHLSLAYSVETGPTQVTAQRTGRGELDLGFSETWVAGMLLTGEGPYQGNAMPSLRLLTQGSMTFAAFAARSGTGIETFADLKGKSLASPSALSPSTAASIGALLDAYGFKEGDVKMITITNAQQAVEVITEGRADVAAFGAAGGATPWLEELTRTGKGKIIGVDKAKLDAATKVVPHFPQHLVKAGTFKGQEQDLWTIGFNVPLLTNAGVPKSLMYEIAKLIHGHIDEWLAVSPAVSVFRVENVPATEVVVPFHDGVVRYLKEANIWTPEHEKVQQEVLARLK